MPASTLVTLCTCPSQAVAEEIANALVEQGVAACINIIPTITSIYKWQGRLERSDEVLMLIKTDRSRYPDLEQALTTLHPYELPEIIAVPVEQGLAGYLNWVTQCTKN
ncbi:MAG: divalent-cation tolerance protein CutA [Candidatus Polarisedimenticolaceae bacterium]|nr:divalent-cation tolerance protein CutA [Candidatus Polarisedimenticolaceae bacterium]